MTFGDKAREVLKEPLVQFLIGGAAVLWLMSGRPPDLGERRVVVDERIAGALAQRYFDSFRRMPSQDELDGLIRDYVKDQVYYREAVALGLDQNDEVVVRRLRRKMEGMAVADAEAAAPSDKELQAIIDKNPARYAEDPRTTFDQIYLGPDTLESRADANGKLAQLRAGRTALGMPAPLPDRLNDAAASEISGKFGDQFTLALSNIPTGKWHGPITSGLGLHLVRVNSRSAPSKPSLATIRQRVENDWRAAAVAKARNENYARILEGYDVVIELDK